MCWQSAMRKGSGKEKGKKKTVVKSPDLTADGLKIINMSGQGMTVLPLSVVGGISLTYTPYLQILMVFYFNYFYNIFPPKKFNFKLQLVTD